MKQNRLKTPAQRKVPQTQDDAVQAIAAIGQHQRERARIAAEMNDELARIRQHYEEQAQPHGEAIAALHQGVQTWCEAHRDRLTDNGKSKTAALASGEVKWRNTPPSVAVRAQDKVLQALRDMGLGRFIRTKEELDKQAVLAEPDAVRQIKGIAITQREEFVITPFETQLAEAA